MHLTTATKLSRLIEGVIGKRSVIYTFFDEGKVKKGTLRRIYRAGEMPGEDFARDTDDVLDLYVQIEHTDFSVGIIQVSLILELMSADQFFVE